MIDLLMLLGARVCDQDDAAVVEVGGTEEVSVVLDVMGTVLDRIIDELTTSVAEVMELGCAESVAVVPNVVRTVCELRVSGVACALDDELELGTTLSLHPGLESEPVPISIDCAGSLSTQVSSRAVSRLKWSRG